MTTPATPAEAHAAPHLERVNKRIHVFQVMALLRELGERLLPQHACPVLRLRVAASERTGERPSRPLPRARTSTA